MLYVWKLLKHMSFFRVVMYVLFFFQKGLLVLSLAVGDVIFGDVKEIPASFPSELRDFLSK